MLKSIFLKQNFSVCNVGVAIQYSKKDTSSRLHKITTRTLPFIFMHQMHQMHHFSPRHYRGNTETLKIHYPSLLTTTT